MTRRKESKNQAIEMRHALIYNTNFVIFNFGYCITGSVVFTILNHLNYYQNFIFETFFLFVVWGSSTRNVPLNI